MNKLFARLGRDDRAELDCRVVRHRDHIAVELRVEYADRREAVRDGVSDGASRRQARRAVQQDGPTSRELASRVHLGEAGHGVLDDDVVGRRVAEGNPHYVAGAGDVESVHGVLLYEIAAHDGRGGMPYGLEFRMISEINTQFLSTYFRNHWAFNIAAVKERYFYILPYYCLLVKYLYRDINQCFLTYSPDKGGEGLRHSLQCSWTDYLHQS